MSNFEVLVLASTLLLLPLLAPILTHGLPMVFAYCWVAFALAAGFCALDRVSMDGNFVLLFRGFAWSCTTTYFNENKKCSEVLRLWPGTITHAKRADGAGKRAWEDPVKNKKCTLSVTVTGTDGRLQPERGRVGSEGQRADIAFGFVC
jgi:hypothetical protein